VLGPGCRPPALELSGRGVRLGAGPGVGAFRAPRPGGVDRGREHALALWDLATGALLAELQLPAYIETIRWLPSGTMLLVATSGAGMHWVAPDLSAVLRTLPIAEDLHSFALFPDGRHAVARQSSARHDVVLLSLDHGGSVARFTADAPIFHLAVSPDGGTVIAADAHRTVHVLHVR
jgi:hypothetical protein